MAGIGEAWQALAGEALAAGLTPNGHYREVYKQWLGDDSDGDIVELQMGLG